MNLEERVVFIIKKNIEKKQTITTDKRLVEDLGVDSLGTLMIISALEEEFHITINEDDFTDIKTVKDVINKLHVKYKL